MMGCIGILGLIVIICMPNYPDSYEPKKEETEIEIVEDADANPTSEEQFNLNFKK